MTRGSRTSGHHQGDDADHGAGHTGSRPVAADWRSHCMSRDSVPDGARTGRRPRNRPAGRARRHAALSAPTTTWAASHAAVDDLVEKGAHQQPTRTPALPGRVDGHGQELGPPAYPVPPAGPVPQGLEYPAPPGTSGPAAPRAAGEPVVPEEAPVQAGHVGRAGDEPGRYRPQLGHHQERVWGEGDPAVQAGQESGARARRGIPRRSGRRGGRRPSRHRPPVPSGR